MIFLQISQHLDRKVGRLGQKLKIKLAFLRSRRRVEPYSGEDSGQIFLLSCTAVFQVRMIKMTKCENREIKSSKNHWTDTSFELSTRNVQSFLYPVHC